MHINLDHQMSRQKKKQQENEQADDQPQLTIRTVTAYITSLFETIDVTLTKPNQQRELFEYLKSLPTRFLKGKITVDFSDFTFGFN